ncbi:MAG: hypothetical protein VX463_06445 [Pseudomonadota bacterium]|nr:hypothetical protein [Pseudomonadota bacterium]
MPPMFRRRLCAAAALCAMPMSPPAQAVAIPVVLDPGGARPGKVYGPARSLALGREAVANGAPLARRAPGSPGLSLGFALREAEVAVTRVAGDFVSGAIEPPSPLARPSPDGFGRPDLGIARPPLGVSGVRDAVTAGARLASPTIGVVGAGGAGRSSRPADRMLRDVGLAVVVGATASLLVAAIAHAAEHGPAIRRRLRAALRG